LNKTDYQYIRNLCEIPAGIDEAGRGALAGPVFAASVIADEELLISFGVKDSKQLSHQKRESIFIEIIEKGVSYGLSSVSNIEIDKINILQATMLAMRQAVEALDPKPDGLFVDGNYFNGFGIPFATIVKGDSKVPQISAASIIAKVSRDRWMTEIAATLYPEYGFEKHKGYGVRRHVEAIKKYGPCPLHRLSFLKNILNNSKTLFD